MCSVGTLNPLRAVREPLRFTPAPRPRLDPGRHAVRPSRIVLTLARSDGHQLLRSDVAIHRKPRPGAELCGVLAAIVRQAVLTGMTTPADAAAITEALETAPVTKERGRWA